MTYLRALKQRECVFKYLRILQHTIGYDVTGLSQHDREQIMALDNHILKTLKDPDFYYPPYNHDVLQCCLTSGLSIGVWKSHALIAYHLCYYPSLRHDNLGRDIDIAPQEWDSVAQFWGVAVRSDFRQQGIAYALAQTAYQIVLKSGYQYIAATCHPENYASLKMLLKLGFVIRKLANKYHGKIRYILCFQQGFHTLLSKNGLVVDARDFVKQQEVLMEGYIGTELHKTPSSSYQIIFRKL